MFFQHTCTIKRPALTTVRGTEKVTLSTIASDVPCTIWNPGAKQRDSAIGRDTKDDSKDFMTATEIREGDIVEVTGFGSYKVGPVDINKSVQSNGVDNYYSSVSKHGSS